MRDDGRHSAGPRDMAVDGSRDRARARGGVSLQAGTRGAHRRQPEKPDIRESMGILKRKTMSPPYYLLVRGGKLNRVTVWFVRARAISEQDHMRPARLTPLGRGLRAYMPFAQGADGYESAPDVAPARQRESDAEATELEAEIFLSFVVWGNPRLQPLLDHHYTLSFCRAHAFDSRTRPREIRRRCASAICAF